MVKMNQDENPPTEKVKVSNKVLNSVMKLFYSKDKTRLHLILLVILGFFLRVIAAINQNVSADDVKNAMFAKGIIGAKILGTVDHPALWHYLTNLSYWIFGSTQFSSRFPVILFGTSSILLVYLISKKIFKSEKAGLIAAFLLAISPFHIRVTIAEANIAVTFFMLLSTYFLLEYLEKKDWKNITLFSISFGLGIMFKYLMLPFILSFAIFIIYSLRKQLLEKKVIKQFLISALIIFILIIPALTFNYLSYQEYGSVDFQFARFLDVGRENFQGLGGIESDFNFKRLFTEGYSTAFKFLLKDLALLILGLIGFIYLFIKNRKTFWLFFLLFFIPFTFTAGTSTLSKHFVFAPALFAIIAGSFHFLKKKHISIALVIIIILNIFLLGSNQYLSQNFYSKGFVTKAMDYSNEEISDDALVVLDQRIYTPIAFWMFNEKQFITANYLPALFQEPRDIEKDIYFVECILDDCGWGTIGGNVVLNQTSEELFTQVNEQAIGKTEIIEQDSGGNYYYPFQDKQKHILTIYKLKTTVNSAAASTIDQTHFFFSQPIGYKYLDNFKFAHLPQQTGLRTLLYYLAYMILIIELILSIFLLLWPIVILRKKSNTQLELSETRKT